MRAKQKAFIAEYLKDFNATQAAIRAGYSPRTARFIGHENLTKPNIAAAIKAELDERLMSADEVLKRLGEQARNTPGSYVKALDTGREQLIFVDLKQLIRDGHAHLIKGVKYDSNGKPVIEFMDSQKALIKIGEAHALFKEVKKHEGTVNIEGLDDRLVRAYEPGDDNQDRSTG